MTQQTHPMTFNSVALALFCAALWGGTATSIQFTQEAMGPFATAGFRFLLGSIFVFFWARFYEKIPLKVNRTQLIPITTVGILLFLQIGSYHYGLDRTNSSHGSVIIGSHPFFVVLMAHFLLHQDSLTWSKITGALIASIGLAVVVLSGTTNQNTETALDTVTALGDIVIIVSSILLAYKTVYSKTALSKVEAGPLLLYSNLIGTSLFFLVSFIAEDWSNVELTTRSGLGLFYQGIIVSGFCFAAWMMLLKKHRASQLSIFAFAQPIFGALFGKLFRSDEWTTWFFVGTVLVCGGAMLASRVTESKEED
jgi:drug/metabolite transporter (DMT)-like permease